MPPKAPNRAYPPRWYINRSSEVAATRKRLLENENFRLGWFAAFVMRRHQGHFGSVRSLAGGGEADRRSDAADAVQKAIGFGDMLGNTVTAAGHLVGPRRPRL